MQSVHDSPMECAMPVLVRLLALCLTLFAPLPGLCAAAPFDDKFRQLEELLPTPNAYRTASGAPGHAYWQQRADYVIRATLDEARREITASEQITNPINSKETRSFSITGEVNRSDFGIGPNIPAAIVGDRVKVAANFEVSPA